MRLAIKMSFKILYYVIDEGSSVFLVGVQMGPLHR
jgi:hypothetical protein